MPYLYQRKYSYYEIESYSAYRLTSAEVYNATLTNSGHVTLDGYNYTLRSECFRPNEITSGWSAWSNYHIKDPEKILLRDQKVLNKEISKWMDISLQAKDQLVFLKGLYDKNSKAIIYYGDLSKEEKEQFKDPLKWRDTPEMTYVMKMADLF